MSKEELLRQTLRRAAGGEPASGDAFGRFRARERRAARWRMLTAVGAGLAAVVALIMTLPGVGGEGTPGPGGPEGTRTPVTSRRVHLVDRVTKYELLYPEEWGRQGEEGSFFAMFTRLVGDPPVNQVSYRGGPCCDPYIETPTRFYTRVSGIDRATADARLADIDAQERAGGVKVERSTRKIDGFDADVRILRYERNEPPEGARVKEWCTGCVVVQYLIQWPDGIVLDVRFVAPNARAYDAVRGDIEALVNSLKYYGLKLK